MCFYNDLSLILFFCIYVNYTYFNLHNFKFVSLNYINCTFLILLFYYYQMKYKTDTIFNNIHIHLCQIHYYKLYVSFWFNIEIYFYNTLFWYCFFIVLQCTYMTVTTHKCSNSTDSVVKLLFLEHKCLLTLSVSDQTL